MTNIQNCISFTFYRADDNKKGKLPYISFKWFCLCLYIIGFYYIFLNDSLENGTLETAKNFYVYKRNLGEAERNHNGSQRKKKLKHKKEDVSKTKTNEKNRKYNNQKVKENKYSTNNDMKNTKVENKSNSSVCNINYNDTTKNLTKKELFDVLNSLETCPSKEDLRNIWNHTIGVAKEGLDDIEKELKASIQKYLDNDNYQGVRRSEYNTAWERNLFNLCRGVASEEVEYTKRFLSLINDEHALDDILNFIYSFLEHLQIIKNELREKYQEELLKDIAILLNKKYTI
ncbi:Plasmodium exported protein (PHISTa), unknown, putative [Plasmodium sp.]|nr:Plasmodium exported protein (PHISTa), unknown, putative [Plasmodium sp.]